MAMINRRAAVLSGVGTALLALADSASGQTTPRETSVKIGGKDVSALAVDDVTITAADENKQWSDLITRIAATGYEVDKFNTSFESGVYDSLVTIKQEEHNSLTHNPRLVEPLLGDLSSLIDRCITYRSQGDELEISGVALGAARLAADALDDIDAQIASNDISGAAAAILESDYPPALAAYTAATNSNLGLGNSRQLQALIKASAFISDSSSKRTELLTTKVIPTETCPAANKSI